MANVVTFYELTNPPVNFLPTGQAFLAQFSIHPTAPTAALPLATPISPKLYAAALDSGYGTNSVDLLNSTPTDWINLGDYLLLRLKMVLSVLDQSPTGVWNKTGFAGKLESNESGANAYALGMIFCRCAIEEWGNAHGYGVPKRFWHYKVATHAAVNLTGQTNPKHAKKQNPDFVVEMGNGAWAAVEAKGTLAPSCPSTLKTGLGQAHKYQAISFTSHNSGVLVNANIGHQVCTEAHFNGTSLEVTQLHSTSTQKPIFPATAAANSPGNVPAMLAAPRPANLKDTPPPPVEESMFMLVQAGDLLRYRQAYLQFQLFPSASTNAASAAAIRSLPDGFEWRVSSHWQDLLIGLPTVLKLKCEPINWALHVFEILTPVFGVCRVRAKEGNDDIRKDTEVALGVLAECEAVTERENSWGMLRNALESLAFQPDAVSWTVGLSALLTTEVIRNKDFPHCSNRSIQAFLDVLQREIQSSVEQLLLTDSDFDRANKLAFTSHSLAVLRLPVNVRELQRAGESGL